jgi:hypothetical protein
MRGAAAPFRRRQFLLPADCRWVVEVRSVAGKKTWSRDFSEFDVKGVTPIGDRIAGLANDQDDGTLWLLVYQPKRDV